MKLRLCRWTFLATFSFISFCSNSQNLTDGLIACYAFSGNANDGTSNHYDGSVNNATLITDRFGNANSAYHFNGSISSYISFPSAPFKINNYSYSLWVNASSFPGAGTTAIVLSVGDVVTSKQTTINLGNLYSAGEFLGWGGGSWNDGPTATSSAAQGAIPNLNQWYHLVLTRSNTHVKFYINGQYMGSGATNGYPAYYGTTTNAFIGVRCTFIQPYNGAIDDMSVYNREITQQEVTLLYQNGLACQPSIAMPIVADTQICSSSSATLTASGGNQYRWYDAPVGGNLLFEGSSFTTPSLTATTPYYVSNVDGTESSRKKVTVTVNPNPTVDCANTTMYYLPNSATISTHVNEGKFPFTFTFAFGDGVQLQTGNSQVQHQYQQPGDYPLTVNVKDANNCQSQCMSTIKVAPPPPTAANQATCGPASVTLSASNGQTYRWYDAQSGGNLLFEGNPFATPILASSKDYFVSSLDIYESKRAEVNVTVNPSPKLTCFSSSIFFKPDADISIKLSSGTAPFTINYDFGDDSHITTSDTLVVHSFSNQGVYSVTVDVIDSNNCIASCTEEVEILTDVFIPNVVTVNEDMKNDFLNIFFMRGDSFVKYSGEDNFSLLVIDRWGHEIYKSNNPSVGWSGSEVSAGIYYYLITLGQNEYRGWVSVLK